MRIGVDVGGTFTDFAVFDGRLSTFKRLSTPQAPERAVLAGLAPIAHSASASVSHGTTVGTNAVLERRGARTAFIATAGFRDLLLIGRQNRTSIYDLFTDRPAPLIPAERSFEVKERVDRAGQVLTELEDSEIERAVAEVRSTGAESVAVCLLFSFLAPEHERRLEEAFRAAGLPVSISSQVLPEFREYERASATALDAYLAPRLGEYLGRLEAALPSAQLHIMQSNGGRLQPGLAQRRAVGSLLSGPAGGVIGARLVARGAGFHNLITLDMGGTSSDVSLIQGEPRLTSAAEIDGLPIGVPVIDLHTVGAGGGSIASVDAGGALRVGPQSAGAEPGPVCYGRGGTQPTVTDADVVLGRLPPDTFTAGGIRLDGPAAEAALAGLADRTDLDRVAGLSPAQTAALGVVDVVRAHMARALRIISLERGHDPADFVLVAFGGAAGLHACDLAREVGIRRVLVPAAASALSAVGMLSADVVFDLARSLLVPGTTPLATLEESYQRLEAQALADLALEGIPSDRITLRRSLDLRYVGQSFELNLPLTPAFRPQFDALHQAAYGYHDPEWPVEIVSLRLHAVGASEPISLPEADSPLAGDEIGPTDSVRAVLQRGEIEVPLFVAPFHGGTDILGPAIVALRDSTVLLTHGDRAVIDRYANLVIEVG